MDRKPGDMSHGGLSFEAVFEQELKEIQERRAASYGSESLSYVDSLQPTVANRLVGLALSGGGPRSAVFNLGVLQALYRHGVFRHVDYLSTVSGGGYIGSTLLNLLSEGGREFPFAAGPRGEEAPLVSWLRNQSVHLAPRRFLDYGLRAAVFLQGILLNFLALTPLLLLVAVGVAERFNQLTSGDTVLARWELIKKAYLVAPISLVVSIAFLAVWSFFHRRLRISRALIGTATRSTIGSRNANRTVWAVVLFVNSVSLIFETLLILLQEFHLAASGPVARGAFLLTLSAVSIAALAAAGPLLGNRLGRWRKAIGVALLACWPVAPLALVFYVAHGLVYSWPPLWQMSSPKAWFPASVLWIPTAWLMANSSVVITDPIFSRAGSSRVQALLSTLMGLFAVVAAGALVLELKVWWMGDTPVRFILVLIAVLFLLVWTVYDANASSTFWFFRDLQRTAFLVKMAGDPPKEVSVFTDPDPRPLAEDHKSGSAAAPYHLINTSLNLHGSDDPSLGDRIHDGFLLSKHVYGSSRTGYWRTRDLEAVFPSMDLATATAASATSTAPNFVNTSSQLLSSLLSLLNLRPGYWLPNPRQLARFAGRRTGSVEGSLWNRGVWKVGLEAYFLEIKGKLTDDQRWVNVADGGYFDNLALYELLRRRCRYIVVSDAGADPEMSRGGLARLTRLARAELGIEIELDLEALTPKGSSPSRHHAAVGVIQYPPFDQGDSPEKGLLLYLKPALTGDENRMITEYATRQPAFPHEGRADRFLGEGQFDAYKDLGFHSVDGLFDPVGPGESAFQLDRKDFFEWLETLGSKLSPKSEAAGGAAGAEGEAREPDRRRDQQRTEEKLFAANLKKKMVLDGLQIDGHSFFADGLNWKFQPRINVLLGRNGYGKSYLLRGLAALLQRDEEVSAEFFSTSPEASARMHLLRDQEEGLISRGGSAEESIGKIPLLAIPDSRFINRSNVLIAPPADVHVGDLKADGAYHFLHQLPYEASVLTFLYDVCFDYFQRRQRFRLPVFELIHDVVRDLTHQTFHFHNIEKRDQARFFIEVLTEGNEDNPLPIQQVSQGTFSVIAMFGQIFNFLKSVHAPVPDREVFDKPAIVIIDEIDAHLHPQWQGRIVPLLRKKFPGVQFLLTAHSPLVVAGCLQGEVSVLRPKSADGAEGEAREAQGFEVYQFGHDFIGWPRERIYQTVFQVEGPDDTFLYYSALEPKEGSLKDAVNELESLAQPTPEDQAKLRQAREDLEGIEAVRKQREALRDTREIERDNRRLERKVRTLERQIAQLTEKSEGTEPTEMGGELP